MKVLVLGESGQLAFHLREEIPNATFWGRAQLDLASRPDIANAIETFAPSLIVNAAAYTAVDKAETERAAAWRMNAQVPAIVAETANALGVPLVHVSTDYVFDGRKTAEYATADPVGPIGVYGATKLAGELAVRALCATTWVLRTSWIFSEHGQNFVRTIVRLASTRDSLRVVADQHGRPTYAKHLARAIARIAASAGTDESVAFGLYHATGGPIVSWYRFAAEIVERAHALGLVAKRTAIAPITTAEYPTAARRPANSALAPSPEVTEHIGMDFDWRAGLERVLEKLATEAQSAGAVSP